MKRLIAKLTCTVTVLCMLLCILPVPAHAETALEAFDSTVQGYSRQCAVLLATEEGDVLYSFNADTLIYGASLIKLAYAVYACRQLDAGVHSLDETMTYTKSWYHGGSGIIRKNGYGKSYTVRELLDYSLRYSDNVAYDMLVYLFGEDGFNEMLASWGYDIRIGGKGKRFPDLTADFSCRSMLEMHAHCRDSECWQTCWEALLNSTDIKVRSEFPEEIGLAVKYGEIEEKYYHEVYHVADEMPYVLAVLTVTGTTPDVDFFKSIANGAQSVIAEYKTTVPTPGDVDYSRAINASDAARVLMAAAEQGGSGILGLSARQQQAADVNGDSEVNASDAALILQYAAAVGGGNTITPEAHFGAVQGE